MKKKIMSLLVVGILLSLFSFASAASVVNQDLVSYQDSSGTIMQVLKLTVRADADGSVTAAAIRQDYLDKLVTTPYIYWVKTIPSTPNPTGDYDITFTNSRGATFLSVANRSATTEETFFAGDPVTSYPLIIPFDGMNLNVANNSVAGALFEIWVICQR